MCIFHFAVRFKNNFAEIYVFIQDLKIAPAKGPNCKILILRKMRKICPMEEKQDIQNLSWGIERVNLHSPDHIFVSEKHERSVATVPNKKKYFI